MTFSPSTRRWLTPFVLTGYVLVATFSGLFHQHGEGSCCSETSCVRPSESGRESPSTCPLHGHRHHDKSHTHSADGDDVHGTGAADPAEQSQSPRTDDPLKHADCAACQLLAEQSVSAPTFVIERTSIVVCREADAVERALPTVVVPAHPPRGPPAAG